MEQKKISELLLEHINETGQLTLDRFLTAQLLVWVDHMEEGLARQTLRLNNMQNLIKKDAKVDISYGE